MSENGGGAKPDRYGFTRRDNAPAEQPSRPSKIGAKEESRTKKWLIMVSESDNKYYIMRSRKFVRRVKKGIPHDLRGRVWTDMLLDVSDEDKRWAQEYLGRPHSQLEDTADGREALEAIRKDLARTFPNHVRFSQPEGHESLLRVLASYAAADPEVGYCQGMSFVTAMFLMIVDENQALICLNRVMTKPMWMMRDLFKPRMPAVGLRMFQYDHILSRASRRIHRHFNRLGFEPSMYATHWFTTIFTYNFPFVLVLRVWDIFLLEGWPIVLGVAVALWRLNEKATLRISSFELMFEHLKRILALIDEDSADHVINEALWVVRWYVSGNVLRNLEHDYERSRGTTKV